MSFERFIGVDWSGARGPSLPGLQAAVCVTGTAPPTLVSDPTPGRVNWRRDNLQAWITERLAEDRPTLVGLDFAFAYPYCDQGAYFPGVVNGPAEPAALWAEIDRLCQDGPGLYGGPFYSTPRATYASYLRYQTYTGDCFEERFRETEYECQHTYHTRPACVFVCVGGNSVGIGSIAGMRLLHHICQPDARTLAIWPFQDRKEEAHTVVEIFPRLFYIQSEHTPNCWSNREELNSVLQHYHGDPLPPDVAVDTEDKADAIVSAAALRFYAGNQARWAPEAMSKCAGKHEGWIFGA